MEVLNLRLKRTSSRATYSISKNPGIFINGDSLNAWSSSSLQYFTITSCIEQYGLQPYMSQIRLNITLKGGGLSVWEQLIRINIIRSVFSLFSLTDLEKKVRTENKGYLIPDRRPKFPKVYLRKGARAKPQLSFR